MFAIQLDDKFLKPVQYIDPYTLFDLVVSAKPKTYKTQAEAVRMLAMSVLFVKTRIVRLDKVIGEVKATTSKAKKDLARAEASLKTLNTQPYKEVSEKIARVQKQIVSANIACRDDVGSYERELSRYQTMLTRKPRIVKVQISYVAV